MMKKMGLATLPFQLSSAEVDGSDQPLLDVMPRIHDYFQQIMFHGIDGYHNHCLICSCCSPPLLCVSGRKLIKMFWRHERDCIKSKDAPIKVKSLDSTCDLVSVISVTLHRQMHRKTAGLINYFPPSQSVFICISLKKKAFI